MIKPYRLLRANGEPQARRAENSGVRCNSRVGIVCGVRKRWINWEWRLRESEGTNPANRACLFFVEANT
jgi:hypothetical protein